MVLIMSWIDNWGFFGIIFVCVKCFIFIFRIIVDIVVKVLICNIIFIDVLELG